MFPDAKGKNQSPIDILAGDSRYHKHLRDMPIEISYENETKIKNTGHSFQVCIDHDTNSCKKNFKRSL